jgi:gluconate 2-dehydrogenase gamma chain
MSNSLTRRDFLSKTTLYGSSLALSVRLPLAEAAAKLSPAPEVLNASQWRSVEAMTARIIPTDHRPGAVEANCVNFIDKALANEEKDSAESIKECLDTLNTASKSHYNKPFAELANSDQERILTALETNSWKQWPDTATDSSEFFETIRVLTILGFLSDPKYGGNKNYVGWQVAGYPGPRHHRNGYTAKQMVGEEPIVAIWDK